MLFLFIGIAVVAVVVLWFVSAQRSLVSSDELCGNALSQIGVQQNSRWDALGALADLTKAYSDHEYNTLMEVVGRRQQIGVLSTAGEVEAQENMITQALGKIMAIAESYPDLKANTTYIKTMDSVNQYENQVRMSRMVYNDSVTKYNRLVRQIPTSIAAGIFGFGMRDYLQTEEGKTAMPTLTR